MLLAVFGNRPSDQWLALGRQFIKTEVVGEVFAGPANDRLMEKLSDGFIYTYVLMWVCTFQRR